MFSLSEGPQQSAPAAVALAVAAPAAEVVTGTHVFPAVLSKGVVEAPASSAGAASAAVPAAVPATGVTVFPTASVGGAARAPASADATAALTTAPFDQQYCSLRYISWGGTRIVSCSSSIGRNIGGGTGDQPYCSLGRIN